MSAGGHPLRAQAFWAFLWSRSGLWLRVMVAVGLGAGATILQLSPLNGVPQVGAILFWVLIVGITALAVDWVVRTLIGLRAGVRVVDGWDLLRGSYLDRIVELGRDAMGPGHADAETLRARLARCPDGIKVLVRRTHPRQVRETVVGYLVCWTISPEATSRYLTGEYESGLDLREEDIVVDHPAAAYITMVYGTDGSARIEILRMVAAHLRALFDTSAGPELLLARPATPEGERLMKRAGMKLLELEKTRLWRVHRSRLLGAMRAAGL